MILNAILLIIAYLLGSIPFGLILTRMAGLGDLRDIGSGNIGTTNVLRTGNKIIAALTLVFDMFKGMTAVSFAVFSGTEWIMYAASLLVVLGHMYPIWLGFKGGKGVATGFGVILMLQPALGMLMLMIWIGVAYVSKFSSLAALTAFTAAPLLSLILFSRPHLALFTLVLVMIIAWKHRANIQRLLSKTESKISFSSKPKQDLTTDGTADEPS